MADELDEFEAAFAEAAGAPKKKRRGRPSKRGVIGWEIVRLVRAAHARGHPLSPAAPTGTELLTAFEQAAATLNARSKRLSRPDLRTTPDRVRETYYRLLSRAGEPLPGTPDIF
ncbi:MAG TPA: hypothetical protein PK306_27675 [Aquabacterium sp.]|nr:hypothetical protein [Aquabacterium sp.]